MLKHPDAETVNFKHGNRPIVNAQEWVKTSHDNLVRVIGNRSPSMGELYAVPTGIKNLYYIFSCKGNNYKRPKKILIKKL